MKPFRLQEEVVQRIRPMQPADVYRIAALHHAAMGNSLWAQLGQPFLRELYRGMIASRWFLGFVYEEQQIEGFIAGSMDVSSMMRSIFLRRAHQLALRSLPGLIKPAIFLKLLETASYFQRSAGQEAPPIKAESLFCSFTPRLRGRRIAGHINKALFDTMLFRGCSWVKITTEVDNKGANRQLQSWGFEQCGTFRFYGKEMVTYRLDLALSPRVDPHDWLATQASNQQERK